MFESLAQMLEEVVSFFHEKHHLSLEYGIEEIGCDKFVTFYSHERAFVFENTRNQCCNIDSRMAPPRAMVSADESISFDYGLGPVCPVDENGIFGLSWDRFSSHAQISVHRIGIVMFDHEISNVKDILSRYHCLYPDAYLKLRSLLESFLRFEGYASVCETGSTCSTTCS